MVDGVNTKISPSVETKAPTREQIVSPLSKLNRKETRALDQEHT